jgi:hypothetical protein
MSVAIEQPLFSAKALLWQAALDIDAGRRDLARTDLQGAIVYLETASHSDQKPTREAAKQLLGRARELQEDLDNGGDVAGKIRHLWERTQAFADRSVEYLAAGWARYRADNSAKADLIEAKLHLANARIDLFTGDESSQARQELTTSLHYLDKAVAETDRQKGEKGYASEINDIQHALRDLSADPAQDTEAGYLALEQRMRGVIRSL